MVHQRAPGVGHRLRRPHQVERRTRCADTIQVVVEYPGDVRLTYDCTLANSFDAEYEMYYGTDAALMIRDNKAWMFKEVDSPLLGWEVYARKDTFYKENGIALVANATKLKDLGKKATEDAGPAEETSLHFALDAFISSSTAISTAVEDFASTYDVSDKKALAEYLAGIKKTLMLDKPWAGYKEGLEAAVTAIKANEAILKGEKVTFQKEWFELG